MDCRPPLRYSVSAIVFKANLRVQGPSDPFWFEWMSSIDILLVYTDMLSTSTSQHLTKNMDLQHGLDVLRISVSMTVTLACFVLELVLNSLAKPHYICRFAFWLDLAASWPGVLSLGGLEDQILKSSKPKKGRTCHYVCMPIKNVSTKPQSLLQYAAFEYLWLIRSYQTHQGFLLNLDNF